MIWGGGKDTTRAQSCLTLCDPIDCSPPGSLSMEFSRQEYWSGLPFPSPGDLPHPGIEPLSPALAGRFFTTSATKENLTAAHSAIAKENTPS